MNAENEFLASAYVDGELTDDERRVAEADPAVMADVERLRALRGDIAAVEPPSVDARETAIAAAMGAFREQYREVAPPVPAARRADTARRSTGARILPFWRRPAAVQWLGAAAAVLAIGLLGVVAVNGLRGGTDNDAATDLAVEEASDDAATEPASQEAERTETLDAATAEAPVAEPAEEPAEEAGQAAGEAPTTMALDLTADAELAAEEPAAADDAIDGSWFFAFEQTGDPQVITGPDDLAAAGRYLLEVEATQPTLLTPTPNTSCGPALARAVVAVDDAAIDVYLVVDEPSGQVIAYDVDCSVVLTADLEG